MATMSVGKSSRKATLYNTVTKKTLTLAYNPTSIPYSKGATYAESVAPGMNYPIFQYIHGNATKFDIELFWYGKKGQYSDGTATKALKFLEELVPPQKNKKPNKKYKVGGAYKPPTFKLTYGNFVRTLALESFDIDNQWLDPLGEPILTYYTLHVIQL